MSLTLRMTIRSVYFPRPINGKIARSEQHAFLVLDMLIERVIALFQPILHRTVVAGGAGETLPLLPLQHKMDVSVLLMDFGKPFLECTRGRTLLHYEHPIAINLEHRRHLSDI